MNPEIEARLDHAIRKTLKGCLLLFGLCSVLILVAYLWSDKPWLPYTDPEIQQILEEQFGANTRLRGFYQQTDNCRIAMIDSDSLGTRYVMVERENNRWKYVDDAFQAGYVPLQLECSR